MLTGNDSKNLYISVLLCHTCTYAVVCLLSCFCVDIFRVFSVCNIFASEYQLTVSATVLLLFSLFGP